MVGSSCSMLGKLANCRNELRHNDGATTNHTHAGDPGQTYNTSKTLTHIMHAWGLDPAKRRQWNRGGLDLVFFTGDYT